MYDQTKLDVIIFLGMIGSITMIGIAIFAGEFEGTILGHGDDVKFGTLILDTPGEWWGFFLAQLTLGILDVYFWEWVKPYYDQITNFPHIPIVTNNHGNGESVGDRLLLSAKVSAAFFPMMIRVTLSVIFVNTQIMAVILVQAIKELVIFVQVYEKITDKHKDKMWMSQKEADAFNKKNEDQEANESSPLQGDNEGNYGGLGNPLKRRSNNIRF
jgi:hypothetical protein